MLSSGPTESASSAIKKKDNHREVAEMAARWGTLSSAALFFVCYIYLFIFLTAVSVETSSSSTPINRPGEILKASAVLASIKSSGAAVTPQMALLQTMAAMHQKVNIL